MLWCGTDALLEIELGQPCPRAAQHKRRESLCLFVAFGLVDHLAKPAPANPCEGYAKYCPPQ